MIENYTKNLETVKNTLGKRDFYFSLNYMSYNKEEYLHLSVFVGSHLIDVHGSDSEEMLKELFEKEEKFLKLEQAKKELGL